jgi:predicted nucleotidyltransferase
MVAPEIVKAVEGYLRALSGRGIAVRFAVVFGSWAKGRAHKWSDIDLVVVSPQYDVQRRFEDVALLWRVAAETDSRIEPIPCGEKQWTDDDSSAVIEIARREGERIEAAALRDLV